MTTNNQKHINAFIEKFEKFLHEKELPNMEGLRTLNQVNDLEFINGVFDKCSDFIDEYMKEHLTDKMIRREIITEFGLKKLIDIMCEFNGDEICEMDLFDFDDNIENWVHTLLMTVAKLYD
mgnify:CR=1 FL=1